jgi:hypothetical protein
MEETRLRKGTVRVPIRAPHTFLFGAVSTDVTFQHNVRPRSDMLTVDVLII